MLFGTLKTTSGVNAARRIRYMLKMAHSRLFTLFIHLFINLLIMITNNYYLDFVLCAVCH